MGREAFVGGRVALLEVAGIILIVSLQLHFLCSIFFYVCLAVIKHVWVGVLAVNT